MARRSINARGIQLETAQKSQTALFRAVAADFHRDYNTQALIKGVEFSSQLEFYA